MTERHLGITAGSSYRLPELMMMGYRMTGEDNGMAVFRNHDHQWAFRPVEGRDSYIAVERTGRGTTLPASPSL